MERSFVSLLGGWIYIYFFFPYQILWKFAYLLENLNREKQKEGDFGEHNLGEQISTHLSRVHKGMATLFMDVLNPI